LTLGDPAFRAASSYQAFSMVYTSNGEDWPNCVDCCHIDTAPPKFLVLAFEPAPACKGAGGVDMKAFVVASAALVASVGAAISADLPVSAVYTAAPYNWSGCYVGAQAGYAAQRDGNDQIITATNALSPFTPLQNASPDGLKVGGFIGCNLQFAGPWVVGLEGDGEWADLSGSARYNELLGDNYVSRTRAQGSIRGRLGYAIDRVFFYGTGGGAIADIHHTYANFPGPVTQSLSDVGFGFTGGLGIEYAFAGNWTGRVEYRYADFGTIKHATLAFPGFTENHRVTENAVRVGLGFKFGGAPPPPMYPR
jgi:outer membrane immunogenic protein